MASTGTARELAVCSEVVLALGTGVARARSRSEGADPPAVTTVTIPPSPGSSDGAGRPGFPTTGRAVPGRDALRPAHPAATEILWDTEGFYPGRRPRPRPARCSRAGPR